MMTLSKIAQLAHVSVSTASKAFSGSAEVNAETRELVFATAKQYGCFHKFYNAQYPKLVIAILAPEFRSAYYTRYLSCIQQRLQAENCELCVSTTDFSEENERALIEYYYQHANVDGVILIGPRTALTEPYEIPLVLIDPRHAPSHATVVYSELTTALQAAVAYLKERRITTVGFVGERLTDGKLAAWRRVLAENGMTLADRYVSVTDRRFEEGGYRATERLVSEHRVPRALICAYDQMAIGAIRCLHDHGLSVPEDVAVLGMDDIPEAPYLNPPLASVSYPTEELCRQACDSLLLCINGEEAPLCRCVASAFHLRRSFEMEYEKP